MELFDCKSSYHCAILYFFIDSQYYLNFKQKIWSNNIKKEICENSIILFERSNHLLRIDENP